MNSEPKKEWEKELNSLLFRNITASEDLNEMRPMKIALADELETFISSLLTSRDEALIAGLEGMKKSCNNVVCDDPECILRAYNTAIKDVVALIRGSREG